MQPDRFNAPYLEVWDGINSGLRDFCAQEGITFLEELVNVVADPAKPSRVLPSISYDGAHFNHRGYEMLGRALADALRGVVKKGDAVLMYGDSITAGFPYHEPVLSPGMGDPKHSFGYWLEELLGAVVVNRGISGDTTGGILQRFIEDEASGNVVIMQGGANDAISYMLLKPPHWTVQMVVNNFKEMTWVAKRRGIKPVQLPLLPFDPEW